MKQKWSRWSGEEVRKLIEMRNAGQSVPEMACALGRTVYAVNRAIRTRLELEDIQLKQPRWSEDDLQSLIRMYRENHCHKSIAKVLNRTRIGVSNKIKILKSLGKV